MSSPTREKAPSVRDKHQLPERTVASVTRSSASVGGAGAGVIDVHRRQVLHLLLADAQPDAAAGAGHRAHRDGHFPAAPQVTLLQEHVSHVPAVAVDDEPLDPADVAVGGRDGIAAPHVHLPLRDGVRGNDLRDVPAAYATQAAAQAAARAQGAAHGQAVVGPVAHLARAVARVAAGSRYEPGLLGG